MKAKEAKLRKEDKVKKTKKTGTMNKLLEDQGTGTIGQRDWYNDFDKAKEDRLRKMVISTALRNR